MNYRIEEIKPLYDEDVCRIIQQVGAEYGAVGDGYGPSDAEVLAMSKYYSTEDKSCYLVALSNEIVIGGCGIAAFNGSNDICELRKLFLMPANRGFGIGRELTERCLDFARTQTYKTCYLDTLSNMRSAISLYEGMGFKHLAKPLNGTIHSGCDVWMLKEL